MAKVLVTGGCGYIGSHVTKALTERHHEAIVYDNLSTGFRDALIYGETLIEADLADEKQLELAFANHKFDAILHFAASIIVPDSVADPLSYYANNTGNLIRLLQVAQKYGVHNIIFSSTASVYGSGDHHKPFQETDAIAPVNPYGTSKAFSERIIQDVSKATALKHVILRYFNVAGADPKQRMGQRSPKATHLIKIASETAIKKRDYITVYGQDYDTPDGTCVRDYIHVDDLAMAHVLSLEYLLSGGHSQVFNCGYGRGYSVREVLKTMEDVIGFHLPQREGGRRPGDAVTVLANTEKIHRTLDWQPQFDDLATIVGHAYEWEKALAKR